MITLLYGTYGSGKTTAIMRGIAADTKAKRHTFLIVPEQASVQAEQAALHTLSPSAQLHLEILNFSRLYNRVCRQYGGLHYQPLSKPIRHLLMWQNLRELSPLLEEYHVGTDPDTSLADLMLSALDECKACGISASQLEQASKKVPLSAPLGKRLRDLSLIYASFDRLVAQGYTDSADHLSRLHEILQEELFFEGASIYLDSFTSFTPVEHHIIERMFAQADNVTISIPLPGPDSNEISTEGIRSSLKRLIAAAERHGGHKQVILKGNRRATTGTLQYLSDNLWKMDVSAKEYSAFADDSICMEICDTPYAEAEAAANHVLELLRQGERCRDIVVLMRNPEQYHGVIEPAFEKNQIPYFYSQKTDLCTLPPIKLLLSALRIKQYHWQKNDVISHIKTGLYDLPPRSIDLFEEYVNTWNISGTRFTDDDWTMNPDGFAESVSERGKGILRAANEVRRFAADALQKFFILLDASNTVPELCRAVYRYFEDIHLETRIATLASKELAQGNLKDAKILQSLYETLLGALAEIATALPEETVDTGEFLVILQTVFRKMDIGTIPTSVDEVTIGSASMLRASNPKYVFVLGLCEGEFPAQIHDMGVFSEGDRSVLAELGMELATNEGMRASDELMYVHRAFSAPSHGLFLFTSVAELNGKGRTPSLPFNRVQALFSNLKPHRYIGSDLTYIVGAPAATASYLRTLPSTEDALALQEALAPYLPHTKELSSASASEATCRIDTELAKETLGTNLRFSSSRFETYVSCPFQYYCTYVLGLREKKNADFRVSHMGTFVHYVLEQLLRAATSLNEDGTFPNDEALIKMTESTVEEYVERICPNEFKQSRKFRHLYTRLKRLSLLMVRNIVEEFSQSEFTPAFFELNTNGRDGNPPPMEFVLKDQTRVSFSGIIDRVDVLKKDGEVYIRIVDYKTGTKQFSLEDVRHGINIQMLLYLFTLCRQTNTEFCRELGLKEDQSPSPAGVVYLSANIPVIQSEDYDQESHILEQAADSLKRSGILLHDEEILLAMNNELSPKFLAGIKRNKDGDLVGSALTDRESFRTLYEQISETVETIAHKLRDGVADAEPIAYKGKDPCAYCAMKPICRKLEE